MSARNRIFGERQLEGMTMATRRILKTRARFRRRRMTRRQIIEAVQRDDNTDPRVFADVEVTGRKMKGLLDTGASVSLLGRGCRELVEELEWPVQPYASMVRTAAGASRPILGRVVLPVKYKERVQEIVLYMCPDLQQELYLGIDFWRAFEIAPDVLGAPTIHKADPEVSEATTTNTDVSYYRDEDDVESDPEMWNLEERQVTQLEAVKREFLQFEKDGLGKTHLLQHRIQLIEGTEPVKDRHYPLSPAKQEIVWAEVDKMLQLGIIEESDSPWSNRTTVVMRPGKNRFCLDARKLNSVTVKDAYPLPCIEGILSRIDETHFISSVDLKFAFWQIELEEKSRAYTAFTVPGRPLYQFRHMPFGLCNAAQQLCRLMDKVIPTALRSNVFVYLDDLLIISADFPTHMKYLRLARWSLELQAFPFSMRYKKGADNVVADTLSRSVEEVEITPEDLLGFETLEFESPDYQELVQEVLSQEQRLPDLKMTKSKAQVGSCGSRNR
ncbi:hypothetical protein ACLKA6_006044 [Drosophila palustris]